MVLKLLCVCSGDKCNAVEEPRVTPQCCVQKQHLDLPHFYAPANTMAESGATGRWEEASSLFCVGLAGQCLFPDFWNIQP